MVIERNRYIGGPYNAEGSDAYGYKGVWTLHPIRWLPVPSFRRRTSMFPIGSSKGSCVGASIQLG